MSGQGETTGETTGPEKIPQPNGGALNSGGTPGNRGGRPPDEFKRRMRELVSRADVEAYTERCLAGEFGPKFHLAALVHATERAYGKAAQPIVGEDGGPVKTTVTLRLVKAAPNDDSG